jgi:teichuronic acid biosynthesis glycosyltransferase TuaH
VASSVLAGQVDRPTFLLPNGADLEALGQANGMEWRARHSGHWVGFVGAFEYWVDFELVLRLARRLRKINFLLVGGGRLFPVINQAVERHKLKNVYLTGPLPYDKAMDHMAAMDICLIPFTRDEVSDGSCPLKLFEYAALRKPIVSTPIVEVERIGKGWVSFGYDTAEFADAIENYLANPDLAAGATAKGRDLVERVYNWPQLAQQFIELVTSAASATPVPAISNGFPIAPMAMKP